VSQTSAVSPAGSIDDLITVLEAGRSFDLTMDPGQPRHDLLDHGLQTAEVLRQTAPGDVELHVAGLLHDIGHVLPPYDNASHGDAGAAYVRPLLGDRVADLIRLHVPAKRYLVSVEAGYELDIGSSITLAEQGGLMTSEEQADYAAEPRHHDAIEVRRADEAGKVQGLDVPSLTTWIPVLRALLARSR
jgi:predicted HD phosphohydrolase